MYIDKYNILIAHNYYQIPGGEDTVVENEINLLKKNGHEVYLYRRHNNEIKKIGRIKKVKFIIKTFFSFRTFKEVESIIKKNNINIVHVHNTLPLLSPSIYYAAFRCKVPVVQTVHNFRLLCPGATLTKNGSICEDCIEKGLKYSINNRCYRNSLLQTLIVSTMLKVHRLLGTYNKVNGYIALTEFNKNKLSGLIPREKIFVKPNFVSSNKVTLPRKMDNYFVFIGRLDKLKGIDLLVRIWDKSDENKLLIIGDGPLKDYIQRYIRQNNMTNIEMLGFVSREKAFEILKKSKAIIMPSQWYEGFPMTIVESFSLGVPVIAGKIGNLSSIIKDNYNGLHFIYNDEKDLKTKIIRLEKDNDFNNILNQGALETFNGLYTDEINYEHLMNIYKGLMGDKS